MWQDIALAQPTDGEQVWVRRYWLDEPFKMYWRARSHSFSSTLGDLTVSGAGSAAFNGPYYNLAPDGSSSVFCQPTGPHWIFFDPLGGSWTMTGDAPLNGAEVDYNLVNVASPVGTWQVGVEAPPGPTVTAGLVIPWHLISRWRTL